MERKPRKIVQFISYISMFVVGIILLLDIFFGNKMLSVMKVLKFIVNFLIFTVIIANAFFYVRTKRSTVFVVLFLIGALLLITCLILPLVI